VGVLADFIYSSGSGLEGPHRVAVWNLSLWLWLDGNGLFGSNSHCPASVYFAVIAVASGAQRMKGYWLRPEKLRHGVGIRMTSFDPPRLLSTISVSGTVVEASLGLVSGGAASPWPHCFRW